MQKANEELEQYFIRLYVRIDGVPTVDNVTLQKLFHKVKPLIKESSCDIPDVVIDRAHRTGKGYNNRKNVRSKSIIVRFTTIRHKTIFYLSRANLKNNNNKKLKLDLTKNRYKIFTKAIETVKSYGNVSYVIRGGSRTTVTSKMERFVMIVAGWKPLTILTKRSILNLATVLDPLLVMVDINCRLKVVFKDGSDNLFTDNMSLK